METVLERFKTEYQSWAGMKQRCFNPRCKGYVNYGGSGITICERWRKSFECFLEDMGTKPAIGYHIHRINGDGDYEPGNCVWLEPHEHMRRKHKPTMIKELTRRQQEVYDFIACSELIPTYRDIAAHFGISVKGAYDHVRAIIKKEKLISIPCKARSFSIIKN